MMRMMMMMLSMMIEIRIMKKVEILLVMIWRMEIEKFLKTQILLEN